MSTIRIRPAAAWLAGLAIVVSACSASPSPTAQGSPGAPSASASAAATPFPAALSSTAPYQPVIDPARFTATVDNQYFPLAPGSRWVMEGSGESAGEVTTTLVTNETKTIMGVVCTVVRDEVKADGALQELTFDWYAQDADGNVWYFGEDTAEYKNGEVSSREGSWEAGVDGAQPGIIMPAQPVADLTYRQEFYAGQAEDQATVVELGATADTPAGSYADVLVTEDWTPLEPDIAERKFYAPGVGLVMERQVRGGRAKNDLTGFTPG
ncbi:MAG TPA: hypothetical protein VF114_10930 [Candidatus Limnocylindria bacterium]